MKASIVSVLYLLFIASLSFFQENLPFFLPRAPVTMFVSGEVISDHMWLACPQLYSSDSASNIWLNRLNGLVDGSFKVGPKVSVWQTKAIHQPKCRGTEKPCVNREKSQRGRHMCTQRPCGYRTKKLEKKKQSFQLNSLFPCTSAGVLSAVCFSIKFSNSCSVTPFLLD